MLYWTVVFFILAVISAIFGFGGLLHANDIGKVLFFGFLTLTVISLILADRRGS